MNTAVKTLGYRSPVSLNFSLLITKQYCFVLTLAMVVLLSAFGLIYMKDTNRQMISQLNALQANNTELHNQWTQSLLIKMQLANQSRVIHLARDNLNMEMPVPKSVVMIHL